ncbi:MAG TPA: GAF domain-containing protein [Frankiaceae bacterium]|nr:GAF domain-containing protein [Frankiaceae bacterium]
MAVADDLLHVDATPDAVPQVRRWVAETLHGTVPPDLIDDAELVASELVTNALLHGRPPVVIRIVTDDVVRIEVEDGSRVAPVRALARPDAMTGRGLSLVSALSREWGVEQRNGGKVVWSELGDEPAETESIVDVDALLAAWDDGDVDVDIDAPRRYTVTLPDVPTDLLLSAKAHVDNLLREFTLAKSGDARATISPEFGALIEDVVSRFAEARHAIKRQAVEAAQRGAPRTGLTLTLGLDAIEAGERYLDALDEIDAYARAARLLTLETPPQHRVFRRWYVEGVITQLRAASAGETPIVETLERRLLREVGVIEVARRAADRAARLQTVTAGLVGATTAEDVGNVVISEGVAALGAAAGGLILFGRGDHLDVRVSIGYNADLVDRLRSESRGASLPTAVAMRTGEPVWLESREERDERYPELADFEPGTVSMCAVPLHSVDGVIGALRFAFDAQKLFDADERRFIVTLGGQTAQALERANALDRARVASEKLTFLADASAALAESLDYRTTLRNVSRLAVPRLADWCVIHMPDGERIEAIAVAHSDPEQLAFADEFQRRYPVTPDAPDGVAWTIRTGQSELTRYQSDEVLVAGAKDEAHLAALRRLGIRSALIVPLAARGRIFGSLSMFYAESGRQYDEGDLALAEDLARRAALAIDNANLFRELTERG